MQSIRSGMSAPYSHERRDLWWRAFRKTVLEPHAITILESPSINRIPKSFFSYVEDKCQNLERHEAQALEFHSAIANANGFGPSPIIPPRVLPAVINETIISRCMEPDFDPHILPPKELGLQIPLFQLPPTRPSLAYGFSEQAFTHKELKELPSWLAPSGTTCDFSNSQIYPGEAVRCPFLLFERTYGHARHELESAMNHCAIDGSSALQAIRLLKEKAWPDEASVQSQIVFSCTIDDDLAIINFHWMDQDKGFFVAPLCKFDLRDMEHLMYFLAWIEAIECWAFNVLLPEVRDALNTIVANRNLVGSEIRKELRSPVTDSEKEDKQIRSMKTTFGDIPWDIKMLGLTPTRPPTRASSRTSNRSTTGTRVKTPLSVTGAMRMRSPRAMHLSQDSGQTTLSQNFSTTCSSEGMDLQSSTTPTDKPKLSYPTEFISSRTSPTTVVLPQPTDLLIVRNPSRFPNLPSSFTAMSPPSSVSVLEREKRVRSLATPDYSSSSRGGSFRTKINQGLGLIFEHTLSKRVRLDNSAPPSTKSTNATQGPVSPGYICFEYSSNPLSRPTPNSRL